MPWAFGGDRPASAGLIRRADTPVPRSSAAALVVFVAETSGCNRLGLEEQGGSTFEGVLGATEG